MRKVLTTLALVMAFMLAVGIMGRAALAAEGENNVSNLLTLVGTASAQPVEPSMTLAWVSVAGETGTSFISGGAATVVWYLDKTYAAEVVATNTTGEAIAGIYTKLTGWVPAQFKLEFYLDLPALPSLQGNFAWHDLGADAIGAQKFGWFDDSTYYFGPAGGDVYTSSQFKPVKFRITPLTAPIGSINVTMVMVNGVTTDPR